MAAVDNIMAILNLQFTSLEGGTQQVIFNAGDDYFGIDILNIKEIIRYIPPTKVPKAPVFVEGVINFRGEIIPVLNLDRVFGSASNNKEYTVIVVVETSQKMYGLLVENVLDIVSFGTAEIQPVPEFSNNEKTQYLKSMAKHDDQIVLMLDLDKLVDFEAVEQSMARLKASQSYESSGKRSRSSKNATGE
ncbi:MAG TPA: chemotaxis protein CheW [Bacillota bacterium]|nr:chemotaxis protein CheW [Bacillota bacterium]HPT86795.1 chemotaxis protein CheW [Bacillota bacterium]